MMRDLICNLTREKDELLDKLSKLEKFLHSDLSTTIDPIQLNLLKIQFDSMSSYFRTLELRIKLLKVE